MEKKDNTDTGYETALQFTDEKNNEINKSLLNKIASKLSTLISNVLNISAFGDILFFVDVIKNK